MTPEIRERERATAKLIVPEDWRDWRQECVATILAQQYSDVYEALELSKRALIGSGVTSTGDILCAWCHRHENNGHDMGCPVGQALTAIERAMGKK